MEAKSTNEQEIVGSSTSIPEESKTSEEQVTIIEDQGEDDNIHSRRFKKGPRNKKRLSGPRHFGGQEEGDQRPPRGNARDYPPRDNAGPGRLDRYALEYVQEKLYDLSGPTLDLPPLDMQEKKFSGRNRLYIGNIGPETTEEEIKEMFGQYGEVNDFFMNTAKFFAFLTFDYLSNAERAQYELNGKSISGNRMLRIRFSPKTCTVKVTNLPPTVTNELLCHGFSVFGEVDRAVVSVDVRGNSIGEGEVDFARKKSALMAVQVCSAGCFFLTNALRPVMAELHEPVVSREGFSEKNNTWRDVDFIKDREVGPWLAKPDTFEYEFGTKWKQIRLLYREKEEALRKELEIEEQKLHAQMGFVKYEYETEMLKKQLEQREMYWEQQKADLEEKERRAEELRLRNEEELRRREEQIKARLARHEEEMKMLQTVKEPFFQPPNRDFGEQSWNERKGDIWQRDRSPPADDEGNKGSNSKGRSFLEEPAQIWKRLDGDDERRPSGGGDLFQRRPGRNSDGRMSDPSWKRNWDDNYRFNKRGRF